MTCDDTYKCYALAGMACSVHEDLRATGVARGGMRGPRMHMAHEHER